MPLRAALPAKRQSPPEARGRGEITGRDTHLHPDRLGGVCVEWAREGRQTEEAEADRRGRRVSEQDGEGLRGRDRQTASQTGSGEAEKDGRGQRKTLDQGEEQKPSEGSEMLRNGGRGLDTEGGAGTRREGAGHRGSGRDTEGGAGTRRKGPGHGGRG